MATITDITVQAGDPSRLNIFLNGKFAVGITAAAAISLNLKIGMTIEPDTLNTAAAVDSAYSRALHFLSFRARSSQEIRRFLAQKEFLHETIDIVIDKLTLNRYIDDEAFAQSLIRTYQKKEGKRAIKTRLINAGIGEFIIDRLLDYDELSPCLAVAEKYLKTRSYNRDKLWRHLYSKGFCSDLVTQTVEKLQNGIEEID